MEWGTYSMASFSNRAFTSCSITRTCWGATSVDNTPMNLGGRDPNCIWYPFSIVCRTQRDIFGRSFHAAKNYTRGTSLSRLVSGFICICVDRTTSWNGEPAGCVWIDRSEILLRGGGHPKATTFPGGPWDICARRRLLRPEAHEVAGLADQSPWDIEGRRAL